MTPRIAVAAVTFDRPKELSVLLAAIKAQSRQVDTIFEIGGAVITVAIGYLLQYRAKRRHALAHADPVDLAASKAADLRKE